ncbi:diaminopimelate epimerase [Hydrogenispora ethanolica]|uniref:Diaminopimelate epimerase n=1 Tax=Hydrogenispora ethanolica TaxID=1082276 RepID=A0A4R1QVY5_HYDET|nr:diaminopimelate epimerase [Hydrogenispora ethanolica]
MMLEFTKMHGLGNDFIVLNGFEEDPGVDYSALARRLCDRHFGVGGDGILVVLPAAAPADIRMRIINADGSEAQMCGNGIRCFAKYVYEQRLIAAERFVVETLAGPIIPELTVSDGRVTSVRVNMGKPGLLRSQLPMNGPEGRVIGEVLAAGGAEYRITSVRMGVPHTVILVPDIGAIDPARLGPAIERHPVFLEGTNVNWVEVHNEREISVRTWERGAGSTLACGTGSCAAAVATALNRKTGRKVVVHLAAGDLLIEWESDDTVYMTGPAETVFQGRWSGTIA